MPHGCTVALHTTRADKAPLPANLERIVNDIRSRIGGTQAATS